jgi:hypothetical protein
VGSVSSVKMKSRCDSGVPPFKIIRYIFIQPVSIIPSTTSCFSARRFPLETLLRSSDQISFFGAPDAFLAAPTAGGLRTEVIVVAIMVRLAFAF